MHPRACLAVRLPDRGRVVRGALAAAAAAAIALPAAARTVVQVPDVTALYGYVNNSGYAGALLVLAAGPYPLDPAQRNCGRIELQSGMGITGVAGDPTKVVIDASRLYPKAGDPNECPDAAKSAAVRLGRGTNSLESLTVTGALTAAAAIGADLGGGAASVRIANVVVEKSARGMRYATGTPETSVTASAANPAVLRH